MGKKLKEVIDGDFRVQGFEEATQDWLLKIDVLRKRTQSGKKVSLEDIERLIHKLCKKYKKRMQWISITIIDGEIPWYSVSIIDDVSHEWLKTIYGKTLYELMSKVALYLYATTRGH